MSTEIWRVHRNSRLIRTPVGRFSPGSFPAHVHRDTTTAVGGAVVAGGPVAVLSASVAKAGETSEALPSSRVSLTVNGNLYTVTVDGVSGTATVSHTDDSAHNPAALRRPLDKSELSRRPRVNGWSYGFPHRAAPTRAPARTLRAPREWCGRRTGGAARRWSSAARPTRIRAHTHLGTGGALSSGQVRWPGIAAQHDMPFKNVEHVDDLITWAEAAVPASTSSFLTALASVLSQEFAA